MVDDHHRWDTYMNAKRQKLEKQFDQIVDQKVSDIFNGISIYVNGFTNPDAMELRRLMKIHGGQFQLYYNRKSVTHIIASSLSVAKQQSLTSELVVSPDWIMDSIKSGCLLPTESYVVYKSAKMRGNTLTARDPEFVKKFFSKSRLHYISTLANQMKDYVAKYNDAHNLCVKEGSTPKLFIHVDMDCFFASVAVRDNPTLKGKPVAITHSAKTSDASYSEIASCNYEARKYGIHNGMLVGNASKLCSLLSCVPYDFDAYSSTSRFFYDTLLDFVAKRFNNDAFLTAISCDEALISVGQHYHDSGDAIHHIIVPIMIFNAKLTHSTIAGFDFSLFSTFPILIKFNFSFLCLIYI